MSQGRLLPARQSSTQSPNGAPFCLRYFGFLPLTTKSPNTPSTSGSTQLIRFKIFNKLQNFSLPFQSYELNYNHPITVHHALGHESGIFMAPKLQYIRNLVHEMEHCEIDVTFFTAN